MIDLGANVVTLRGLGQCIPVSMDKYANVYLKKVISIKTYSKVLYYTIDDEGVIVSDKCQSEYKQTNFQKSIFEAQNLIHDLDTGMMRMATAEEWIQNTVDLSAIHQSVVRLTIGLTTHQATGEEILKGVKALVPKLELKGIKLTTNYLGGWDYYEDGDRQKLTRLINRVLTATKE